jgi:DNA mismatch endonuclease, patch repair protein
MVSKKGLKIAFSSDTRLALCVVIWGKHSGPRACMVDRHSVRERSWNMSRIRSKDTTPEKLVRSLLHQSGYRFRTHYKTLPGKPDIVLPKYRTVIFVHGCFWHRHEGCKYSCTPASHEDYWGPKLIQNVVRDSKNEQGLRYLGWNVIVVWECELKHLQTLTDRLNREIAKGDPGSNI